MFGVQEILIIVGIVLGVLLIPRILAGRQPQRAAEPKIRLSGKTRMAITASAIFPALTAAYFQPWHKDQVMFFYIGVGPVVLAWLLYWVFVGFKKKE
ncbi:MAG TPA: hypothetical protein EYP19_00775 [Desulfobacterales bacterium]|jgi:hypothetical protein|nr:hypothetical protein [Desulfobacterales bacterium]